MPLNDLLQEDLIWMDLAPQNRSELLATLAERIARVRSEYDVTQLKAALEEREALGGTEAGHGIYLPHARIAPRKQPLLALAKLATALPAQKRDQDPLWLAALTLTDPEDPGTHLALLSQLAKIINQPAARLALKQASTPKEMVQLLHSLQERPKVRAFFLLFVILPDDEAVYELLNRFAGIGIGGATTITGRGMGEVLGSGPSLFAGFRELFGAVGSSRIVLSAIEQTKLEDALEEFEALKAQSGLSGVAFYLPLSGTRGMG